MSSCVFLFLPPRLVTSAPQGVTRAGAVMSLAIHSLAHSLRRWGMGHSGVGGLMLEGASEVAGWAPRGTLLPQGPLLAPELAMWWAQGGHWKPALACCRTEVIAGPLTRLWSVPL